MTRLMVPFLAVTLGWAGLTWAEGTRPSTAEADVEKVEQLMKQLNSPRPSDRKKALEEFGKLGPETIPVLKRAAEKAPFEVRALIDPLIKAMEESLRGAVIVASRGWGVPDLWPGDIIYRIDETPIHTCADHEKFWANAEYGVHAIHAWTREGQTTEQKPLDPYTSGGPRLFLLPYDERYAPVFRAALFTAGKRRFGAALPLLDEARRLGAPIEEDFATRAVYAACHYYTGQVKRSHELLEDCIQRALEQMEENPWLAAELGSAVGIRFQTGSCYKFGSPYAFQYYLDTVDGHLGLYLRQRTLQARPDVPVLARTLGAYLFHGLHRYPEAIAVWAGELRPTKTDEESRNNRAFALAYLFQSFQALKMHKEAEEIARLVQEGEEAWIEPELADLTLRAGDLKAQHEWLYKDAYRDGNDEPMLRWPLYLLLRFCVQQGMTEAAKTLIRSAPPVELLADDVTMQNFLCGWRDLADVWAEVAREAMKQAPDDRDTLSRVFMVLSRHPQADVDELERIMLRLHDLEYAGLGDRRPEQLDPSCRAIIALQRGQYDEVGAIWSQGQLAKRFAAQRHVELAEFMKAHAHAFAGEHAVWLRTWQVIPAADAGWILVTRDGRIGLVSSDLQEIRELPLPDPAWSPNTNEGWLLLPDYRSVVASETGKTIGAIAGYLNKYPGHEAFKAVYSMRWSDDHWTHLMDWRTTDRPRGLREMGPLLDDLHDYVIQHDGRAIDLETRRGSAIGLFERDSPKLLADGSWMQFRMAEQGIRIRKNQKNELYEIRPKLIREVNAFVEEKLGEPVTIYSVYGRNYSHGAGMYLFTDRGVLLYHSDQGTVERLPLPDRPGSVPVVELSDGDVGDGSFLRLGLLPHAGGATYRMDTKTNKITPEGCINESYPGIYWHVRSEEANRQAVIDALARAGIAWPLKLEAAPGDNVTDSAPARSP